MNNIEQIDRLDKAIKDAEMRLKSIESNITNIDNEIKALSPRLSELESNLEFHKRQGTVPKAHEYKKTKTELVKIKHRLNLINSDRTKCDQACKDINQIIEKFKNDRLELLKHSNNNVLSAKFGGKRGQK